MRMTWIGDAGTPAAQIDRSAITREVSSYGIALGAVAAAAALTRITWPFFEPTPFVLLFAATFVAARWASESAALVSIIAAAIASSIVEPVARTPAFEAPAIVVFVTVALVLNRLVVGRNRAEAALRASAAQFRAAWDNHAFGAALLNTRGLVERINPALERTLGYASSAWAGVSFGHFSEPGDVVADRERFTALMNGADDRYHADQRYRRADGTLIWCRVTMSTVSGGKGRA